MEKDLEQLRECLEELRQISFTDAYLNDTASMFEGTSYQVERHYDKTGVLTGVTARSFEDGEYSEYYCDKDGILENPRTYRMK